MGRSVMRLGRLQTIGLVFGFVGLFLVAYVAPNVTSETKGFTFDTPPDPPTLTFTPGVAIATIGVLYLLTAVASFFESRSRRTAQIALVGAGVLFLPLIIVVALALSESSGTNVVQLVVESLRLGTPVALGAMAGLWCERSGVVNIGIEGMMLGSAGVGFMIYSLLGDASSVPWLWASIGVAVLTGGLIAALHALMSVTFRVDQIISGVVVNLLALGVTGFLRSEVIVPSGITSGTPTSDIAIPLLSAIPVIGPQLFDARPIFFLMFVVVTASWWVLWHTKFGLRVRSVGENPHAAETLGIDVIRTRYVAVIIGGLIAGLGGAWFSMESQGGFQDNMTNGAGFIALAALIFGKWRPWTAFGGAMLFGFTRALGSRLQILGVEVGDFEIPSEFWQSLPFVVTIVVVAGLIGRAIPPASIGQPFERSR
ncbi:ABC transporter permease [Actinospongicola halichondriae]|uniref:ABC transporter permease n=1 Tax=Actinospongicola halichondriae TaxID=3236844 RepID=UPI003D4DA813